MKACKAQTIEYPDRITKTEEDMLRDLFPSPQSSPAEDGSELVILANSKHPEFIRAARTLLSALPVAIEIEGQVFHPQLDQSKRAYDFILEKPIVQKIAEDFDPSKPLEQLFDGFEAAPQPEAVEQQIQEQKELHPKSQTIVKEELSADIPIVSPASVQKKDVELPTPLVAPVSAPKTVIQMAVETESESNSESVEESAHIAQQVSLAVQEPKPIEEAMPFRPGPPKAFGRPKQQQPQQEIAMQSAHGVQNAIGTQILNVQNPESLQQESSSADNSLSQQIHAVQSTAPSVTITKPLVLQIGKPTRPLSRESEPSEDKNRPLTLTAIRSPRIRPPSGLPTVAAKKIAQPRPMTAQETGIHSVQLIAPSQKQKSTRHHRQSSEIADTHPPHPNISGIFGSAPRVAEQKPTGKPFSPKLTLRQLQAEPSIKSQPVLKHNSSEPAQKYATVQKTLQFKRQGNYLLLIQDGIESGKVLLSRASIRFVEQRLEIILYALSGEKIILQAKDQDDFQQKKQIITAHLVQSHTQPDEIQISRTLSQLIVKNAGIVLKRIALEGILVEVSEDLNNFVLTREKKILYSFVVDSAMGKSIIKEMSALGAQIVVD